MSTDMINAFNRIISEIVSRVNNNVSDINTQFDTNMDIKGDSTIGTDQSNTLTINSSGTFNSDVIMKKNLEVEDTINTTTTINNESILNNNVTIGSDSNDVLVVKSTPFFHEDVTMNKNLDVVADLSATNLYISGTTTFGTAEFENLTVNNDLHVLGNANIDGNLNFGSSTFTDIDVSGILKTDDIIEHTLNNGTTINGSLLKNNTIAIPATTNQLILGETNTTTLNATQPSASRIYTIPDSGANSNFIMSDGTKTINGNTTLTGITTLNNGSLNASNVLALDGSKNIITTSTPTFTTMTLSNTTNQLVLGETNTTTLNASQPVTSRIYTIPDTGNNSTFIMSDGNNTLSGITTLNNGSLNASNVLALDGSKNIITTSTPTFTTMSLANTTNQLVLGETNTTTLNATQPASSRIYTIPDSGANSNFVMSDGTKTINGNTTLTGVTTLNNGSLNASNVLALDGTKNIITTTTPIFTTMTLANTTNQLVLGETNTTTLNATQPVSSRIYTLPDTGNNSTFIMSDGNNTLSGTTTLNNGSLNASNVLALDGSKNIITTTTPTFTTMTLANTTNQLVLGETNTTTLNAIQPLASRTYTIPDTGTNSNFIMSDGTQTINDDLTFASKKGIILTDSGTNNVTLLAPDTITSSYNMQLPASIGTNGQVLTSNGVDALTWTSATNTNTASAIVKRDGSGNFNANDVVLGSNLNFTGDAHINNATSTGTLSIGDSTNTETIYIGNGANVANIHIGNASSNILLNGTTTFVETQDLKIEDKLIEINKGNIVGSGFNAGIAVLENDVATAYIATTADRSGWALRAPASTGDIILKPGNNGCNILSGLTTTEKTITIPDISTDSSFILADGQQTFNNNVILNNLNASSVLTLDATKNITSNQLTNGQILIGKTGDVPLPATITGTNISVTNGANTIGISIPQSVAETATPKFVSENLSATTNQLHLGDMTGNFLTIDAPTGTYGASRIYGLPDAGTNATFIMSNSLSGQFINNGITFNNGVNISGTLNTDNINQITDGVNIEGIKLQNTNININKRQISEFDDKYYLFNLYEYPVSFPITGGADTLKNSIIANGGGLSPTSPNVYEIQDNLNYNGEINLSGISNIVIRGAQGYAPTISNVGDTATSIFYILNTGGQPGDNSGYVTIGNLHYTMSGTATEKHFLYIWRQTGGTYKCNNIYIKGCSIIGNNVASSGGIVIKDEIGSTTEFFITTMRVEDCIFRNIEAKTDEASIMLMGVDDYIGNNNSFSWTGMTEGDLIRNYYWIREANATELNSEFYDPYHSTNEFRKYFIKISQDYLYGRGYLPTEVNIIGCSFTKQFSNDSHGIIEIVHDSESSGSISNISVNISQCTIASSSGCGIILYRYTSASEGQLVNLNISKNKFIRNKIAIKKDDTIDSSDIGMVIIQNNEFIDNGTNIYGNEFVSTSSHNKNIDNVLYNQLGISQTSNQLVFGNNNTTTINAVQPSASRIYNIPDVGIDGSFIMNNSTSGQTFGSDLTLTGTSNFKLMKLAASRLLSIDSSKFVTTTTTPSVDTITLSNTTNQLILGDTNTTTINSIQPSASRIYTIPDTGSNSNFIMGDSLNGQTINGDTILTTFTDGYRTFNSGNETINYVDLYEYITTYPITGGADNLKDSIALNQGGTITSPNVYEIQDDLEYNGNIPLIGIDNIVIRGQLGKSPSINTTSYDAFYIINPYGTTGTTTNNITIGNMRCNLVGDNAGFFRIRSQAGIPVDGNFKINNIKFKNITLTNTDKTTDNHPGIYIQYETGTAGEYFVSNMFIEDCKFINVSANSGATYGYIVLYGVDNYIGNRNSFYVNYTDQNTYTMIMGASNGKETNSNFVATSTPSSSSYIPFIKIIQDILSALQNTIPSVFTLDNCVFEGCQYNNAIRGMVEINQQISASAVALLSLTIKNSVFKNSNSSCVTFRGGVTDPSFYNLLDIDIEDNIFEGSRYGIYNEISTANFNNMLNSLIIKNNRFINNDIDTFGLTGLLDKFSNSVHIPEAYTRISTVSVSDPPTTGELNALFGSPTSKPRGWHVVIDNNNLHTNYYRITSNAINWIIENVNVVQTNMTSLKLTNTTNQLELGETNTITINADTTTATTPVTYLIPYTDTDSSFIINQTDQSIDGNLTLGSQKGLLLTDDTTNKITLLAPNSTTPYNLYFPQTIGNNNQIFTTDGNNQIVLKDITNIDGGLTLGNANGFSTGAYTNSIISITGTTFNITFSQEEIILAGGKQYTKNGSIDKAITLTDGLHYVYFDNDGVIQETNIFVPDIIMSYCYIAAFYWNTSLGTYIYLGDERHGIYMNPIVHNYLHNVFGTRYASGLPINLIGTVDNGGALDADAQLSIGNGVIYDEDLRHSITQITNPTQPIWVLYKDGVAGVWNRVQTTYLAPTYYPIYKLDALTNPYYNEFTGGTWQLTEISNNNYANFHYFATNDYSMQIICVMPQTTHGTIGNARTNVATELKSIITAGLPFTEFCAIGSVIFQINSNYANDIKATVRSTSSGDVYQDFRTSQISSGATTTNSHSNLIGLENDDHLQYALLEGRTGDILNMDQINMPVLGNQIQIVPTGTIGGTRIYTIPDTGTNSNFIMSDSTAGQTINNGLTLTGTTTLNNGSLNVSNVLALDGSKNIITTTTPTFTTMTLSNTTNQLILGTTNTTTINADVPVASRTYTIPDSGANSTFIMSDGTKTINGDTTFTNSIDVSGTNVGEYNIWVDKGYTGSISNGTNIAPYTTISEAMASIGHNQIYGTESYKRFVVNVITGDYDEDIIIPENRNITFVAHGFVYVGTYATPFTPTNSRNIQLISDSETLANIRYAICFIGSENNNTGNTENSSYNGSGWKISGDFEISAVVVPADSFQITLQNMDIYGSNGIYISVSTTTQIGTIYMYIANSYLRNGINLPYNSALDPNYGTCNIEYMEHVTFYGQIIANQLGSMKQCQTDGTSANTLIDVNTIASNYLTTKLTNVTIPTWDHCSLQFSGINCNTINQKIVVDNSTMENSYTFGTLTNIYIINSEGVYTNHYNVYFKSSVNVVSINDVASLEGLQTIDGYTLNENDSILLINQSTAVNNGIWVVGTGAPNTWVRRADGSVFGDDYTTGQNAGESLVYVTGGDTYIGTIWQCTNKHGTNDIIDTDPTTWINYITGTSIAITGFLPTDLVKAPVKAVATSNITTSNVTTIIDGYTLLNGDRVLLIGQTTSSENGIWIVNTSGAWTFGDTDYVIGNLPRGYVTYVLNGTSYHDTIWKCTSKLKIDVSTDNTIGEVGSIILWEQMTDLIIHEIAEIIPNSNIEYNARVNLSVSGYDISTDQLYVISRSYDNFVIDNTKGITKLSESGYTQGNYKFNLYASTPAVDSGTTKIGIAQNFINLLRNIRYTWTINITRKIPFNNVDHNYILYKATNIAKYLTTTATNLTATSTTFETYGNALVRGSFYSSSATNQLILGNTNTTTINAIQPLASRTYTLPDTGTNSNFILTDSTAGQTINNGLTLTGTTILNNGSLNASNVLALDGSKNIITTTTPTFTTMTLSNTTNQLILGTTNTTTINADVPVASRTYTIPDSGANSTFIMSDGTKTINGDTTFTNSIDVSGTNVGEYNIWVDKGYTGSISNGTNIAPYTTISEATTSIGNNQTYGAESLKRFVVNVIAGDYDEDIVIPENRNITFIAHGFVYVGTYTTPHFTPSGTMRHIKLITNATTTAGIRYAICFTGDGNYNTSPTNEMSYNASGWKIGGSFEVGSKTTDITSVGFTITLQNMDIYGESGVDDYSIQISPDTEKQFPQIFIHIANSYLRHGINLPYTGIAPNFGTCFIEYMDHVTFNDQIIVHSLGSMKQCQTDGTAGNTIINVNVMGTNYLTTKIRTITYPIWDHCCFNFSSITCNTSNQRVVIDGATIENSNTFPIDKNNINSNLYIINSEGTYTNNYVIRVKSAVNVVSIENIDTLSGTTTVDGRALVADESILLINQNVASTNGIWVIKVGAWERRASGSSFGDNYTTGGNPGEAIVYVTGGNTYIGTIWKCSNLYSENLAIDTDDTSWINYVTGTSIATTGFLPTDLMKAPVNTIGTSNVTSLSGTPIINGITLSEGNRILLIGQTTSSQNGIWVVHAGDWDRPIDYPTGGVPRGSTTYVLSGTSYANTMWKCISSVYEGSGSIDGVGGTIEWENITSTNIYKIAQIIPNGINGEYPIYVDLMIGGNSVTVQHNYMISRVFDNVNFDNTKNITKINGVDSGTHIFSLYGSSLTTQSGTFEIGVTQNNITSLRDITIRWNIHGINKIYSGSDIYYILYKPITTSQYFTTSTTGLLSGGSFETYGNAKIRGTITNDNANETSALKIQSLDYIQASLQLGAQGQAGGNKQPVIYFADRARLDYDILDNGKHRIVFRDIFDANPVDYFSIQPEINVGDHIPLLRLMNTTTPNGIIQTYKVVLNNENATTIEATQASGGRTITIMDPGQNTDFILNHGTQTLTGTKTLNSYIINNATITTTITLTSSTSGSVYELETQNTDITITLPTTTAGIMYSFLLTANAGTNNIIISSGTDILRGYINNNGTITAITTGSGTTITINGTSGTAAGVGSIIKLIGTTGNLWMCEIISTITGGITLV